LIYARITIREKKKEINHLVPTAMAIKGEKEIRRNQVGAIIDNELFT